jgi:hypothetical protein
MYNACWTPDMPSILHSLPDTGAPQMQQSAFPRTLITGA